MVATDPPYSSGGQYRGDRAASVHDKYVSSGSSNKSLPGFTGDNRDQRAYAYWSALWMSEALRITRPGGVAIVFTDWRQLPTTIDAVQAGGWVWRGIVPWVKPSARPQSGRFTAAAEFAVWASHGPMPIDHSDPTHPGWIKANPPRDREHVTQKPLEVMTALLGPCPTGGTVLDPFAGSGTTGVAAVASGRRFVGVEVDPHHAQVAARRIADAAGLPVEQPDGQLTLTTATAEAAT